MFGYSSTAQTHTALSDLTGRCISGGSPQILPRQRKNRDGDHEKNQPVKVLATTGKVNAFTVERQSQEMESENRLEKKKKRNVHKVALSGKIQFV